MDIAAQYARALFESTKPSFSALKQSLTARGRSALLPRIFAEYKKLLLKKERALRYAAATAESERTRVLLELYRALIK